MEKIVNPDNLYGNHEFYDPDGNLLFLGNVRRMKWYLKKGLADVIEEGEYKKIRLNFKPKGPGPVGDEFYLSKKENRCVVTGSYDNITKHHVVPYCFRKHFPYDIKSRSSHDVLLVTLDTHKTYEKEATKLKNQIAVELDLPTLVEWSRMKGHYNKAKGIAFTLIRYHKRIPIQKIIPMMVEFEDITTIKPTLENLLQYVEKNKRSRNKVSELDDWGKMVVDNYGDIHGLCKRWREHFLSHTNPSFLPKGWDINKNIFK